VTRSGPSTGDRHTEAGAENDTDCEAVVEGSAAKSTTVDRSSAATRAITGTPWPTSRANEEPTVNLWIRSRPVDNLPDVPVMCYGGSLTATSTWPKCPLTLAVTVAFPAASPVTVNVIEPDAGTETEGGTPTAPLDELMSTGSAVG
jgi:hypothetical protein